MERTRGFTFPSVVGALAVLVVLAALGIPYLVNRQSEPQTTVVAANLRLIVTQELVYASSHPEGAFATLEELRVAGLLDRSFDSRGKGGYSFQILPGRTGFSVRAAPVSAGSSDQLVFFSDETGVIRVAKEGPAGR